MGDPGSGYIGAIKMYGDVVCTYHLYMNGTRTDKERWRDSKHGFKNYNRKRYRSSGNKSNKYPKKGQLPPCKIAKWNNLSINTAKIKMKTAHVGILWNAKIENLEVVADSSIHLDYLHL